MDILKNRNLKTNLVYNFSYQVLLMILPFFTTAYISRTLGATSIGTYSYYYSLATYFVMFSMLGIANYGNREIAYVSDSRNEMSKKFISIYSLQLLFTLLSIVVYAIFILDLTNKMTVIMLFYIISSAFDVNWFFFGIEKFKITVLRNSIIKIITAILIFLLINKSEDIVLYSSIMVGSIFVSQLCLWPYLLKEVNFVRIDYSSIFSHIKPVVLLFIPTLAVSLYKILDKIMLGHISGMEEVGYYECSEKTLFLPICFITALGTVMMPRVSNLIKKGDIVAEKDLTRKGLLLSVFISAPLSLGLSSVSNLFVPVFLGENYEKCVILMNVLLPSCVFIAFANVVRTQVLIPRKLDKEFITSVLIGAILNIIGNYFLIPIYSSMGAAFSTLMTEFIVCLIQIYIANKYCSIKHTIIHSMPFVIFSLFSFYIFNIIPFNQKTAELFFRLVFGALIYIILCFLYYKIELKRYLNGEQR